MLSFAFLCCAFAQDTTRWSRPSFIQGFNYFFSNLDNFNLPLSNYGYPKLNNFTIEYEVGFMTLSPNEHWRIQSNFEFSFQNASDNTNYANKIKMNSWGGYSGLSYDLFPKSNNFHLFPLLNLGIKSRSLDFYKGSIASNTINNVLSGNVQQTNVSNTNAIIDLGIGFETTWGFKNRQAFSCFNFGYRFEIQDSSIFAIYTVPDTNFGGWFFSIKTRYQPKRKTYRS